MNQKNIGIIVAVLIISGGSFYGGTTYEKSSVPARGQFSGGGQFASAGGARRARTGGGMTAGSILSRDATSMTIKMQDGSTRIVLVSASTQVMKSASGTLDDLSAGTNVVVTGSANSDGSITAQSIQLRPAGAAPISGQIRTNDGN